MHLWRVSSFCQRLLLCAQATRYGVVEWPYDYQEGTSLEGSTVKSLGELGEFTIGRALQTVLSSLG